jgi:hypothetical protein
LIIRKKLFTLTVSHIIEGMSYEARLSELSHIADIVTCRACNYCAGKPGDNSRIAGG